MVDVIPNKSLQKFTTSVADQLRNPNISGKEAVKQSALMGAACIGNFAAHSVMALNFFVGACTLKASEIACAFFGLHYDMNSSPASREHTLAQTVTQMHKALGSLVILATILTGPFKPQWVAKASDRFGFSAPKETYYLKGQRLLSEGMQFVRKHPRAIALSVAALVAFDLYKTGYLAAGASTAWSKMPYITWDKPGECPAPTICPDLTCPDPVVCPDPVTCPDLTCPEPVVCPDQVTCPDLTCPDPIVCPDPVTCPEVGSGDEKLTAQLKQLEKERDNLMDIWGKSCPDALKSIKKMMGRE